MSAGTAAGEQANLDSEAGPAKAVAGAITAPLAAIAASPIEGKVRPTMSRRQALAAADIPAAVAMRAIAGTGDAAPDARAMLSLWQRWRLATEVYVDARTRADEMLFAMPEEIRALQPRLLRIAETLQGLDEFSAPWHQDLQTVERVNATRTRLQAEGRAAEETLRATGLYDAEATADELEAEWSAIEHEIVALDTASPIGLAVQLHLGLDRSSADTTDLEWKVIAGTLRHFLPALPAEMRAAIGADIAKVEANAVRFAAREAEHATA